MLLFFGDPEDLTAAYLRWLASRRGLECVQVDEADLGRGCSLVVRDGEVGVCVDGHDVPLRQVTGAVVRLNPHPALMGGDVGATRPGLRLASRRVGGDGGRRAPRATRRTPVRPGLPPLPGREPALTRSVQRREAGAHARPGHGGVPGPCVGHHQRRGRGGQVRGCLRARGGGQGGLGPALPRPPVERRRGRGVPGGYGAARGPGVRPRPRGPGPRGRRPDVRHQDRLGGDRLPVRLDRDRLCRHGGSAGSRRPLHLLRRARGPPPGRVRLPGRRDHRHLVLPGDEPGADLPSLRGKHRPAHRRCRHRPARTRQRGARCRVATGSQVRRGAGA